MTTTWKPIERPGFLGRQRDAKIRGWNSTFGVNNWRLAWRAVGVRHDGKPGSVSFPFLAACRYLYEPGYLVYFQENPKEVDYVCSFSEVIDNAQSNIKSGLDYTKQEAASTHIQDIAIRNCLRALGRWFEGTEKAGLLIVRGRQSNGARFSPGRIPFIGPPIEQPSLSPSWAAPNSIEDFWQSNKWLEVKEGASPSEEVAAAIVEPPSLFRL